MCKLYQPGQLASVLVCASLIFLKVYVQALSSGAVGLCDADSSKWGCVSGWGLSDVHPSFGASGVRKVEDRFKCLDADAKERIMSWAKAPEKTPDYVVATSRNGDGPTSYKPGGWYQKIHVLTLGYYKKYRGLMLYAVDKNNEPVGSWALPDDPDFNFWHPPTCGPSHVLHQDSGVKNFNNIFQYRTPPPGTGPITFKALFKVGAANTGEFYYPEVSLVLEEAATTIDTGASSSKEDIWALGNIGESCDDVCYGQKMQCESARLVKKIPKTQKELEAFTKDLFPCYPPILSDCKMGSPAASSDPDYQCYLHDEASCSSTDNVGTSKKTEAVKCEAAGTERRFCICKDASGKRFLRVANDEFIMDTVAKIRDGNYINNYYSLLGKRICLLLFFAGTFKLIHITIAKNKRGITFSISLFIFIIAAFFCIYYILVVIVLYLSLRIIGQWVERVAASISHW